MVKVAQKQTNKSSALIGQSKALFFIVAGLIALATFGVYWQVNDFGFITYDDPSFIYENNHVRTGLTSENIRWAFLEVTNAVGHWHPLTWLSHMVDCELFGLNAGPHHIVNVLFHLANTVLLFWVLFRMTGGLWPSAFVAALFALHPLHVESVVWITERKDVLSTLFWILTMWAYLRYTERKCAGRYVLVVLVFALGLMAKPMLVTLPFVLLLLDYWPLGRLEFSQPISKVKNTFFTLVLEKLPLFALSAAGSILAFVAENSLGAIRAYIPLKLRLGNAVVSYARYLVKMVWPEKLSLLYPLQEGSLAAWQVIGAVVLLIFITLLAIRARHHKWLAVGWFWYLGTFVPVIGIVQIGGQAIADRYTYVPLIGVFIIIAWTAGEFVPKWRWRNLLLGILAVVILFAFSVRTWFQVGYWRDSITLYKRSISVTSGNHDLLYNLAVVLAGQGEKEEAVKYFREELEIWPDDVEGHTNLGILLREQGRFDEAIGHFRQAIKLQPNEVPPHLNLGISLERENELEAIIEFQEVLRIEPRHAMAHSYLGFIFGKQSSLDKAIEHCKKALQTDPDVKIVVKQISVANLLSELQKAKVHYEKAIGFHAEGDFKQAVFHYRNVLTFRPDYLVALNNLAWILATCENEQLRNPVEAVGFAKRACELTSYKEAKILDTLGVAYAATGEFAEAVSITEKAVELAKASGDDELANDLQRRLGLYKTDQPYRPPAKR